MKRKFSTVLHHLAAITVAATFLLPLAWMLAASLRPAGLPPPRGVEILYWPPTFDNYARIFDILPFARYALNSFLVALTGVLITLVTASWAGFGMSLLGKRAQLRLLVLSIFLQMIPFTALWLSRFLLFARLGIANSYFAMISPALMGTSPLFILLFYWTFRRTDHSLFESASLDGARLFQIWWKVALPLARPALMAVGLLAFLYYWNDFISPLLYLRSQTLYTLPIGLLQLQEMDRANWPLLMAAAVVVTAPTVAVFAALQRSVLWWESE
jgi:multiple sugar transport system permease protein